MLFFLLLSNSVTKNQVKSLLFSRTAIIFLLFIAYLGWNSLFINGLGYNIAIYSGLFQTTIFTQTFGIFIIIISAIILTLTSFFPKKIYSKNLTFLSNFWPYGTKKLTYDKNQMLDKTSKKFRIIEYSLIIIFIICGALFLISTNDLVSMFLSIELQSYGLYIISTLYRDSESSTGSGLTYFLLGGLSSCFILLGSALLYFNSGTTNLENIFIISNISEMVDKLTWYQPYYLHLSFIIMISGFLFKISAAPFHFWSPDVYDGVPTIVTTYLSIIPKISILIFFLPLVFYTQHDITEFNWKNILLISSLFSLIIGSILGLTQFRIKRLYAFSTINHVGFILLALSINSTESIQAYVFYILQYSLANLNAFFILISMGYLLYSSKSSKPNPLSSGYSRLKKVFDKMVWKKEHINENNLIYNEWLTLKTIEEDKSTFGENNKKNNNSVFVKKHNLLPYANEIDQREIENSPIQIISQIKGYFYVNPFMSISLIIALFSFAGIPPIIGFFGKQMVLSAALDSGYVFMSLIAIITSVISAGYYLNIVKEMFFFHPSNTQSDIENKIEKSDTEYKLKYDGLVEHEKSKFVASGKDKIVLSDNHNIIERPTSLSPLLHLLENINNNKNSLTYNQLVPSAHNNIILSSSLTSVISILTLILTLFIYIPDQWFNVVSILTLFLFKS